MGPLPIPLTFPLLCLAAGATEGQGLFLGQGQDGEIAAFSVLMNGLSPANAGLSAGFSTEGFHIEGLIDLGVGGDALPRTPGETTAYDITWSLQGRICLLQQTRSMPFLS